MLIIAPLFVYLPFWDSTPQLWQYFPCSITWVPHPWQKNILLTTKMARKRQPKQQAGLNLCKESPTAVSSTQYPLRQMHAQQFELSTEEVDFSTEELLISTEQMSCFTVACDCLYGRARFIWNRHTPYTKQFVIVSTEELDFYGRGMLLFLWFMHWEISKERPLNVVRNSQFDLYRAPLYFQRKMAIILRNSHIFYKEAVSLVGHQRR